MWQLRIVLQFLKNVKFNLRQAYSFGWFGAAFPNPRATDRYQSMSRSTLNVAGAGGRC